MIFGVAGNTFRVTLTDGTEHDVTPKPSDEVLFEKAEGRSASRIAKDGDVPGWAILSIIRIRLERDGVTVPATAEDFADVVTDFEMVNPGKAEGSAPTPPTG